MSTATKLMEMGELKGIEKGREEGVEIERKRTIKKMLMKGLSIEVILEITELSAAEIEVIRNLRGTIIEISALRDINFFI